MLGRLSLLAVLFAGLYFLLRRLLRRALAGSDRRRPGASEGGVPATGAMMVRDEVCKTYITPTSALSYHDPEGKVHYFCSEKCRSEYIDTKS